MSKNWHNLTYSVFLFTANNLKYLSMLGIALISTHLFKVCTNDIKFYCEFIYLISYEVFNDYQLNHENRKSSVGRKLSDSITLGSYQIKHNDRSYGKRTCNIFLDRNNCYDHMDCIALLLLLCITIAIRKVLIGMMMVHIPK